MKTWQCRAQEEVKEKQSAAIGKDRATRTTQSHKKNKSIKKIDYQTKGSSRIIKLKVCKTIALLKCKEILCLDLVNQAIVVISL